MYIYLGYTGERKIGNWSDMLVVTLCGHSPQMKKEHSRDAQRAAAYVCACMSERKKVSVKSCQYTLIIPHSAIQLTVSVH